MSRSENLANRKWLVSRLRAEVVGPDPAGDSQDIHSDGAPKYFSREDFRKPKKQPNGEEILWQDAPTKRYGAGILYPAGIVEEREQARADEDVSDAPDLQHEESQDVDEKIEKRVEKKASTARIALDDSEDYDITLANAFRPSAIGLSFLADFNLQKEGLRVELVNVGRLSRHELDEMPVGTYRQVKVMVGDPGGTQYQKSLWFRGPLLDGEGHYPSIRFSSEEILSATGAIRRRLDDIRKGLEIVLVPRAGYSRMNSDQRLITISVINRAQPDAGRLDEQCLFQVGLRIRGLGEGHWIRPYPETEASAHSEKEPLSDESINKLLYRQYPTFAIGHGCAADWSGNPRDMVSEVWTDVMPAYETPSTSADLFVETADGIRQSIKVSMRKLAGLDPADNGQDELELLVKAYENWIESLKAGRPGAPSIPEEMHETASGLIKRCEDCLKRIRDGIRFLSEQSEAAELAREAFRLANHAMLIAQLRATRDVREPNLSNNGQIAWVPEIAKCDPSVPDPKKGYWRAFQIAFLLMSLRSITDPAGDERETVDLIWFPTGGGKTEAYLGLTAFTILFNRLSGRNSGGADVLMRYTLRLLTAQQFQRAALLFCALEHLRLKNRKLGEKAFRIGLWVGGSASPNSRKEALQALEKLERDPESNNPFVLLKCPWCGAKFGPTKDNSREPLTRRRRGGGPVSALPSVMGYSRYARTSQDAPTVVFRCNDAACEFGAASTFQRPRAPLPIVVIDEDLLDESPNLVIGTVDKFAMLAWKPEARRLFGIGESGRHEGLPPSLIIQDELHLISGPLGSMVGAYETVIERLCRQHGVGDIRPKIIASTATISRAREQVKHLYAREDVFLFPPSGLEAGDSFFARDARNDDGSLMPGRLYLGVLAPSHGSLQTTEARVFASLMQHAAIMNTSDAGRDPWWTLLCFFNSIRELGSAASLFVADTRDYLRVILDRHGHKYDLIRKLFEVSELTSRIRSDQVPKELERLEKQFCSQAGNGKGDDNGGSCVDACLASNIIEVGVDVTRLALMAVVGQPKTTSQYIQVSSRVGRDIDKPGLVVVLYGQSKPRDRSHYEKFRPYHQKLYAQVEPTSVTPFSPPAVDRALHGILVAAVRQLGIIGTDARVPYPYPLGAGTPLRNLIEEMIEERVSLVAPEEREAVMEKLMVRLRQWEVWQPAEYGGFGPVTQDPPLIYPAGSTEPPVWNGNSWPTMSSLRDVDASCEAEVTRFFNQIQED